VLDWQKLEGIGGLATSVAVVFAVVFGVIQFRQLEAQRRQAATQHYLTAFTQPEIVHAIQNIMRLPDGAPPKTITEDARLHGDVIALGFVVESVGSFVYTRTVDLHDVDRIAGGFIRSSWRKVRPFVEAQRPTWPNLGEWWQWLAERMDEDPVAGKQLGAQVAFKDWKR
jgi:hypothetical protein